MADSRLDVLRAGVAGVLSQELPRPTLAVKSEEATELRLAGSAVIHAAIACQNPSPKGIDHMLL